MSTQHALLAQPYLSNQQLQRALEVPDLTDPAEGRHAVRLILDDLVAALNRAWPRTSARIVRDSPLVTVADNYDRLGYDPAAVTRDSRYSHYVGPGVMLRSHTSASIPAALDALAAAGDAVGEVLLVVPGVVHRRDAIDRTHVGTPHQVDLWRISSGTRLAIPDLEQMISVVVSTVLPGADWRTVVTSHPYTDHGRQVDVLVDGEWLELAECGLVPAWLLRRSGLDPAKHSGLALGMGLDRAVMLRKGVPDIRYLRSTDPRVEEQMRDLEPWRPVSTMPPVRRDISIVVDQDQDVELLGDRARAALGDRADDLESVVVLSMTGYHDLPEVALRRLGLRPDQVNMLVRLTLRPISHTLTDAAANELRDAVYLALHQGPVAELITRRPTLSAD